MCNIPVCAYFEPHKILHTVYITVYSQCVDLCVDLCGEYMQASYTHTHIFHLRVSLYVTLAADTVQEPQPWELLYQLALTLAYTNTPTHTF